MTDLIKIYFLRTITILSVMFFGLIWTSLISENISVFNKILDVVFQINQILNPNLKKKLFILDELTCLGVRPE